MTLSINKEKVCWRCLNDGASVFSVQKSIIDTKIDTKNIASYRTCTEFYGHAIPEVEW